MKKNYLFLSALLALSVTVLGQSQRFVLFEEFTNASCGPCAAQNPAFDALLAANATKCTSIKYHTSWPGTDPMYTHNTADVNARVSYYSVTGVPHAVMDGTPVAGSSYLGAPSNVTQAKINTEYAIPSPFELYINQQLSPGNDSIYVTMLGKATAAVSGALVAHCVVIEKHIHFNSPPGGNGEKDFYNVMKKMLPSSGGTNLPTSFEVGDYFVLQFAWKLANVYSNSELSVVGFIQDAQTKAVYQAANTSATPITGPYQNDLTVLNPGNMQASVCNPVLEPTFDLQNNGTSPLTSAEIRYKINDGDESTYQWTGNLDFLQRAHISLPGKEFTVLPSNVLKIYGVSTNGGTDDYTKNDTLKYTFAIAPMPGSQVTVFIKTDNNPGETTWDIKDIGGNLLASGGPYTQNLHTYSIPVDLGFGTCYVFRIFDAGGNGLCCDNGIGFYKVYNGNVTVSQGNSFGSSVVNQFYSQSAVNVGETPDAASFSVYPNPAWQKSTISFTNAVKEQVTVQVYNMQGAAVINLPTKEYAGGQHEINLDCSRLDAGVYTIRLIAGNKAFNQKLTVNK
jgi:hypothetical protein